MTVPEWVQDAVFYQIFPDRFANGDPSNDPPNVEPWGAPPTLWGYQGGDLRGILQRLDYLQDLGATALYLNPIFHAGSNHRYNTIDYDRIDPLLGTASDFEELVEAVHRRGMRVILDGVFNHSGRGFHAFVDLLENEEHSAFRHWYHVKAFPLDAFGPGKAERYEAWWGIKSLPKFNTGSPEVRRYLLGVARRWIERGADGWRLDVPNEIDDDTFWAEFRAVVKAANPEAYLVGEIWTVDPRWVAPDHFDGLMNYPVREALLEFLVAGQLRPSEFAQRLESILASYPPDHLRAHYLPLGSHDTPRLRTVCADDRRLRQLLSIQFALPGAPSIYYGDEVGLEGGKDPDSRRAFPWDPAAWDTDLRAWVRRLAQGRRSEPALCRGEYIPLSVDDRRGLLAFARKTPEREARFVLNASDAKQSLTLPAGGVGWQEGSLVRDVVGSRTWRLEAGGLHLTLEPRGSALLVPA